MNAFNEQDVRRHYDLLQHKPELGLTQLKAMDGDQVIGIGHSIGVDSTDVLNPLNQSVYDDIEADETKISILGADFQVFFDEDEEDEIISTIVPSVPVMIKTLEGWEFIAPSRRQNIDRLRDNQKKGDRFIDWL